MNILFKWSVEMNIQCCYINLTREDEFARRYKKKYLFCDVCGVGGVVQCRSIGLNVIFRQNFACD